MKKIFFSVMAIAALAFTTSCGKEDTPEPKDPVALATPVLTISNQTEDSFTVSWAAIENAVGYTYHMGEEKVTTETSVTFTGLEAGSYTVRVKANAPADSKDWTDSAFADVTVTFEAQVPDVWFEQDLYTTEDPESGLTTSNGLAFTWTGVGVVSVEYGLFEAAAVADMTNAEVVEALEANGSGLNVLEDATFIGYINDGGLSSYFDGLAPSTEYALITFAYHESGAVCDVRSTCATEAAVENPLRGQWIGEWTLTSEQTLLWEVDEESNVYDSFVDEAKTVTVTIEADQTYGDQVLIYGFTQSALTDMPALGVIAEDGSLEVYAGVQLGDVDQSGYAPYWVPYCEYNGAYTFVTGQFPAYTFSLSGDAAEGLPYEGEVQSGGTFKVASLDIYALGEYINFYVEEWPFECLAGNLTLTKAAAAPKRASFDKQEEEGKAVRANIVSTLDYVAF